MPTTEADVRHVGSMELRRAVTLDEGPSVRDAVSAEDWAAIVEGVHLELFESWQQQVDLLNGLGFDDGLGVLLATARPAYYDEIVFRHDGWLPAVEEQLEEGGAFVAVGFMHVLTDQGLPALLAARGWDVTLVGPDGE